jgi:hypothetical protein
MENNGDDQKGRLNMTSYNNSLKAWCGVCAVVLACIAALACACLMTSAQDDLASLRAGLQITNCKNCKDRFSHFFECYHGTMSPEVPCRTDACIENKHWYIECEEECASTGDCVYHIDMTQMYRWQERKYSLCSFTNGDPFYQQQSTRCAPDKEEYVRCITTACDDGIGWGTSPQYGRKVCGN